MKERVHHDYPYRLKLVHPDGAELRLERKGRWFRIDPAEAPAPNEVVVLTGSSPERVSVTAQALRDGASLTIVAAEPLLAFLKGIGSVEGYPFPSTVDGVPIDALPYVPVRGVKPLSSFWMGSIRRPRPGNALRHLMERARLPEVEPCVLQFTFEDGARLVHLDLSLHRETAETWVDAAVARFGNPEWLVVGCPYGEAESVARHVARFAAKRVLVAEIINTSRRALGLPTELVTPLRDHLVTAGVEAHVFGTQTSFRFE